jgi:hypothetical protein
MRRIEAWSDVAPRACIVPWISGSAELEHLDLDAGPLQELGLALDEMRRLRLPGLGPA